MKQYVILAIGLLASHFSFGQVSLMKKEIEKIIENKELEIGFAVYDFSTADTATINGNRRFPMQSVFKFPIALAMLDKVDRGEFDLNQKIHIGKEDLRTDLWSPIEKKHPAADVKLPLSEIIWYTVAQSDNVGCDLLLKILGGPSTVHRYVHSKGITDISIKNNEQQIQSSWAVQFDNWATPLSMIQLLRRFDDKELLLPRTHAFLWEVMSQTSTGSVRAKLPKDAFVAYKTGTSGYNKEKISAATNCVGIMLRPDGGRLAFAVFITNSKESVQVTAEVIADIAAVLYTSR